MTTPVPFAYLGHMVDLCRKIEGKTKGMRREEFDRDENLRLALAQLVQTVGGAARRVSPEFQLAHPELPWAAIAALRDTVVPDDMDLDEDAVWRIALEEVPRLTRLLAPLAR